MEKSIDKKILEKLIASHDPISSSDLAFSLHVSEKTILKYLNFLKQDLPQYGAKIEIKQGSGSYLLIENQDLFSMYLKKIEKENIFLNPKNREIYILTRLLTEANYLNIYEFADELAISPSSLRSSIKSLKLLLNSYNLTLKHSHSLGYKIKGCEKDIRNCLIKECKQTINLNDFLSDTNIHSHDISKIEDIIKEALEHFNIAISASNISSLALHYMIAINRTETNNPIVIEDKTFIKDIYSTPEFFVSSYIAKQLDDLLTIKLPKNEITYLTMHLSGKQRIYGHEKIQVLVNNQALVFYNKFLRKILQLANVDFFDDDELRISLLNHIVPFLHRVQNNNQIVKSELANIKNQFTYAYELALCGISELNDTIKITNAEISYFALHLALAIEKRKASTEKFNVALICDEISSMFSIISYKLTSTFEDYINSIFFLAPDKMPKYNLHDFPLVINTTDNIYRHYDNIIQVSPFLNFDDMHQIEQALKKYTLNYKLSDLIDEKLFFLFDADDMPSALAKQIAMVKEQLHLPDDFLAQILAREKLEPTEYDNRIALPHPLDNHDCPSFISVARLHKPIIWKEKNVQLIFLLSSPSSQKMSSKLFEKISQIITNEDIAQKLLSANNYQEFIAIFNSI
ncbi:MAG: PRD domain-containing protein [Erysipelotrichaceae bacterium]|nr:PRD domain-containing protein [Erysipelotrichaceae bacterium]MDY5251563.1 PRD domain-containing protein [Erysipelotrichaceae bacterium]